MKIESYEIEITDITQMPEPNLSNIPAWIVTEIDLATRKPAVFFDLKVKGCNTPFASLQAAKARAELIANSSVGKQKFTRFAFIRIQKLEVA